MAANISKLPALDPDTTAFHVGFRFVMPDDVYQPALWCWAAVESVLVLYVILSASWYLLPLSSTSAPLLVILSTSPQISSNFLSSFAPASSELRSTRQLLP